MKSYGYPLRPERERWEWHGCRKKPYNKKNVQNENDEKNTVLWEAAVVAATSNLAAEPSEPELIKSHTES